jgi:hypothetical protein
MLIPFSARRFVAAAFAIGLTSIASASPVTYRNGNSVMAEFDSIVGYRQIEGYRSPTARYAIGAGWTELSNDDRSIVHRQPFVQINWLAHRFFQTDSVANLYLEGGAGSATGNDFVGARTGIHGGYQFDWESRRWYFAAKQHWWHNSAYSQRMDTLQLGIAAYRAEYDELATWFVLQARQMTGFGDNQGELIPQLRLFRRNQWFELGFRDRHSWFANYMINF